MSIDAVTGSIAKEVSNEIGDLLRQLRSERGMSLGLLAKHSGVHKATLSRWEAGKQRPSLAELEATLSALNGSPQVRHTLIGLLAASGAPRARKLLQDERQSAAMREEYPEALIKEGMPGSASLLRALRLRRGWSQEQVGFHMKRHGSAISLWESGDAWPKPDALRELCHLLGATPQETTALLSGPINGAVGGGDEADGRNGIDAIDALEGHFRSHVARVDEMSELYPAMDLPFIAWEADLWRHGLRRPSVLPLLAEVYAHHANYLRNASRLFEARVCARKSLALVQENAARFLPAATPDWSHLSVVCLADAAAKEEKHPRPARGEAILRDRLSRFDVSVPYTAWLYRKLWGYQFLQGKVDEADLSLQAGVALTAKHNHPAQWGQGVFSLRASNAELQRCLADQLLQQGRAELAVGAMESLPETGEENPVNRLRDYRLWAETCLQTGRRSDAQTWLERAYAEIEASRLPHRRADFETIAARL